MLIYAIKKLFVLIFDKMEILIFDGYKKFCSLCFKENHQEFSELSLEVQDLFFELTQLKVNILIKNFFYKDD
jgi:hypothetical protein